MTKGERMVLAAVAAAISHLLARDPSIEQLPTDALDERSIILKMLNEACQVFTAERTAREGGAMQ